MNVVFVVEVLIVAAMTVDSKIIRHLSTHRKVPRTRTTTTVSTLPTKHKYIGEHDYDFHFPFPTTEHLEKIYQTFSDYNCNMDTAEFSDMMNPPDNISAYERMIYPTTYDMFTFFNHKERNFKEEVLYKLNTSFLKPVHLNMTENMVYWRIINKVPEKYWKDKQHVYKLHIVSDKFRNWHHNRVSVKVTI